MGIDVVSLTTSPMTRVDSNSPGPARTSTEPRFSRSCRASRLNAASKVSVGRKT